MDDERGMTLAEVLVVLGLLALILGAVGIGSLGDFQEAGQRADRDMLIDALLLARARAQSGRCAADECAEGQAHGVLIGTDSITVFEGSSYADRLAESDLAFPRTSDAPLSGDLEIIFFRDEATPAWTGLGSAVIYRVEVSENGWIHQSTS